MKVVKGMACRSIPGKRTLLANATVSGGKVKTGTHRLSLQRLVMYIVPLFFDDCIPLTALMDCAGVVQKPTMREAVSCD